MPNGGTRRVILGVGIAGVAAFVLGCGFFLNNQFQTARLLLIAANVLIIPLFIYLVTLRSRASAEYKRQLRKQEAQKQKELSTQADAQAKIDQLLKANDIPIQEDDRR